MIVSRALELGISLHDLDNISVGFLIDILEQRNEDTNDDGVIEATPEIQNNFFK